MDFWAFVAQSRDATKLLHGINFWDFYRTRIVRKKLFSIFRSVNSASPPAQGCCGTPTPTSPQDEEKMVEYLKELQAEKESLEALQDGAKTANAIKLIEQGKILKLRPPTTFEEDN